MSGQGSYRILIADDEPGVRALIEQALAAVGHMDTVTADSVETARRVLAGSTEISLVLLDLRMPGEDGLALLAELARRAPRQVCIVVSGIGELPVAVEALKAGAYDYVVKPFSPAALQLAVGRALKRRQMELEEREHRERMAREVEARLSMLERTRKGLLRAMCMMAEFGETGTMLHLDRVSHLSTLLAEELAHRSPYAPLLDEQFLPNIAECASLHDIGKAALPDGIRRKPGPLTAEEMEVMQRHTTVGHEICLYIQEGLGPDEDALIRMAADVTWAHHESWDGTGYPRGIEGPDIPLSARIVGLADLYDVCCTPTPYRAYPMEPEVTGALVESLAGTKFDPVLVAVFRTVRPAFEDLIVHGRS